MALSESAKLLKLGQQILDTLQRLCTHFERGQPEPATKRPMFSGQRLAVFDWQAEDLLRTLGAHATAFGDLFDFFQALDERAVRDGLVIPKRDSGAWLQAQLVREAQRRGIPLDMATLPPLRPSPAMAARSREAETFGRSDEETAQHVDDLARWVQRHKVDTQTKETP